MSAAQKPAARTTTAAKSESVSTAADTDKGKAAAKSGKEAAAPKDGLGKVAYEAYSEATGGKSFSGDELPSWDERYESHPQIAEAWEAAAQAVLSATFGRK